MLADEKLVGALCANFAEAAEPEASASLLSRLCMSQVRTEPAVPLACLPRSSHQLYSMLHESKCIATVLNKQAHSSQDETHEMLVGLQKIKIAISKGKQAGLFPIPSAYSSLLKAYGQCQQWHQVREVLIGMIQSGVQINKLHYLAALRAYHKNNRCCEAEVGSVLLLKPGILLQ